MNEGLMDMATRNMTHFAAHTDRGMANAAKADRLTGGADDDAHIHTKFIKHDTQSTTDFIDLHAGIVDDAGQSRSTHQAFHNEPALRPDAVSAARLSEDNTNVACFTAGTLIDTAEGKVPVEQLRRGTRLSTGDGGLRPVRAVLRRTVDGTGDLAPVRISAGALGNERDLLVSPAHRMLMTGWRAQMLFGLDEALVSAFNLLRGDMVARVPMARVTYYHILLDRHEIIFAEGAATESYHLTRQAVDAVECGDAEEGAVAVEIARQFPELMQCASRSARPVIEGYRARSMAGML